MAQCFFLLKQFEDVNVYLKSIGPYLQGDDKFNYNYGIYLVQLWCLFKSISPYLQGDDKFNSNDGICDYGIYSTTIVVFI
jgi:hypothetical protein